MRNNHESNGRNHFAPPEKDTAAHQIETGASPDRAPDPAIFPCEIEDLDLGYKRVWEEYDLGGEG